MKKIYTIYMVAAALSFTSCNDWLDVKDATQEKEEDMFSKKGGFQDALTGCYMSMAERSAYGEYLTMSSVESLANLWVMNDDQSQAAQYYLKNHNYTNENSRANIKAFYGQLFNTVAQVNVIVKNLQSSGNVISDTSLRAIMQGEAIAMRAYCQFDILRLFGQLPQGGAQQVSLPYSYTTSIDEMPSYYSFDEYKTRLLADVDAALALLKDNDPLFKYTFSKLNSPNSKVLDEDYLYYRQSRLNYWAVKGLQARIYLYLGDKAKAYAAAKEILDAKGADGNPVMSLSGISNLDQGYNALPSECLFYLSKFDLISYSMSVLSGGGASSVSENRQLVISADMMNQLFEGINTAASNRYQKQWNRVLTPSGTPYYATKKYWYDTTNDKSSITGNQIIPMIRMSEIYLIAIETTADLNEANSLYNTYMRDRNILINDNAFQSLSDVQPTVIKEYRREFYAEGQMFYVYKRINSANMMWRGAAVSEGEYILPLPESEYNPNTVK